MDQKLINTLGDIILKHSGVRACEINWGMQRDLHKHLEESLEKGKGSLHLVMQAFPCKIPGHTGRTLGILPDEGEAQALAKLSDLCDDLSRHVPTKLSLVSEGHVVSDLLGVSDEDVDQYQKALRALPRSPRVEFNTVAADQLGCWLGDPPADYIRAKMSIRDPMINGAAKARHEVVCDTLSSKVDMCHTMASIHSQGKDGWNVFQERCTHLAQQFCERSANHAALVRKVMPEAMWLTPHKTDNWSEATPFRLSGSQVWSTPWNSVPLHDPATGETNGVPHAAARDRHSRLEHKNGQPWRYVA